MPKKKAKNKQPELSIRPENRSAQRAMWLSVIVFATAIAILWGWSAKIKLSNVNFSDSPENKLIKNTQTEWKNIFSNQENINTTENNKKIIKENLEAILGNMSTATNTLSTSTITNTFKY